MVLSLCELNADSIFLRLKNGFNFKMYMRRQKSAIKNVALTNTKSVAVVVPYQNVIAMILNLAYFNIWDKI